MSLSGYKSIEKVKFLVGTAAKEYYVDKVLIKAKPEGRVIQLADRSYRSKIIGYHLSIVIFAEDVVQDLGTAKDFIALQSDIEDNSVPVYFYPDASRLRKYEVINIDLKERTLLETDFGARIDSDVIRCNTKNMVTNLVVLLRVFLL